MAPSNTSRSPAPIVPIILAAGRGARLPEPHALAEFGGQTAMAIAVENCRRAGLARPVVVFGCQAGRVRRAVPRGARTVVNRHWRSGMLSSIRAGARQAERGAALLLYPVDLPLLAPAILRRLARAFARRRAGEQIVSPVFRGRAGHPVILAAELRSELARARTARDIVERDAHRVKLVRITTAAIYTDFDTPAELRHVQRAFLRARRRAR